MAGVRMTVQPGQSRGGPTPSWSVLTGDCREVLGTLPRQSFQCCVTSPPYFGLRDYGHDGQIGLEPTPDDFVDALVEVFRGVHRVLADDGTVWLNLGDTYAMRAQGASQTYGSFDGALGRGARPSPRSRLSGDLKNKDLIGIPWMVAFALRADGWWLRQEIIWHKRAPMPESVTDRCTRAHEQVFMLTKAPRYFYDAGAIRDPDAGWDHPRSVLHRPEPSGGVSPPHNGIRRAGGRNGAGANKRDVWTLGPEPCPQAHGAVMPTRLAEPCILAGSREGDTVLDPFAGAGTTGLVALRHGRSFTGVEINESYAELARARIRDDAPLLNVGAEAA